MLRKYSVYLPDFEREELLSIVKKGIAPAYRIKHAQILLNADKNGPILPDWRVADFIKCHPQTVFNVRKRYHEQGLKSALDRKFREEPPIEPILDGHKKLN
nr:helix-turn-helix domain-containing protein [uncultured Methanospirillum sp.]